QGLEQAAIGIETGGVEDGVFGAEELAELCFKLLMNALGPADEADTGHAITPLVERGLGGGGHGRMLGQAKIVVGTEIQHRLAVGDANGRALRRDDDALALVSAGTADVRKLGL